MMLTQEAVLKEYLINLGRGDYEGIMALFAEDAMVKSPLYGNLKASKFYRHLLNDTRSSTLSLKNILIGEKGKSAALHFEYLWVTNDHTTVNFEVVDVFDFKDQNKILLLTIIYDTSPIREQLRHQEEWKSQF